MACRRIARTVLVSLGLFASAACAPPPAPAAPSSRAPLQPTAPQRAQSDPAQSNPPQSNPAQSSNAARAAIDIAVTFDDLPSHGPRLPGQSIVDVHRAILEVLAAHGIEQAYGFVNGDKASTSEGTAGPRDVARSRPSPRQNHTWSHADVTKTSSAAFTAEIRDNDALLASIVGDDAEARRKRRVFRYPFLRQGSDRAALDRVRNYLASEGYRIAEVTIDFGDWAYNEPYVRCMGRGSTHAVDDLRWDFVHRGVAFMRWSDAAARSIYGSPIPHVLLLHSGSFDAAALDELLTAYEKAGARWISLDEALAHAAYREDVRVPSRYGGTLLEQRIERDRPPHPPFLMQPLGLLEHLCR